MRKSVILPASNVVYAVVSLLFVFNLPVRSQSSIDFMNAMKVADCIIPFDVDAPGTEYKVNWGMDAAWDWDYNVNLGVNHIGKGNFNTGRVSFQPIDLVIDNGDGTYSLTERQKNRLKWRCDLMKRTGTTEVNINCDHEALTNKIGSNGFGVDGKDYTGRNNYRGKPQEWYRLIKASVAYVREQGLKVISVSPFNEPDFVWDQAMNETQAMSDFLEIAKLIKADPYFDGIRVCGGNTLNCDRALPWYNYLKEYLDEGNTHQLAGAFDTYANFFSTVKADGKATTADELHNVGEAIVGVQYGMENGIWWGFDSRARGQFCVDSNEGVRLGYGENRSAWTNGAVYRNENTGEVHGYFGSSERQALASTIQYISTTKDVYFNGYGPTRSFVYNIPGYIKSLHGGNGYQYGQVNAERLFDITWGEDVPPFEVNGTYKIFNAYSKKVVTHIGNLSNIQSKTLSSSASTASTQNWKVYPIYVDSQGEVKTNNNNEKYVSFGEGVSGDVSYWCIDNAGVSTAHLNVLNNLLDAGAGVISYNAGHGINEQWYIKYVKDGYYFIISRLSNKYLHCNSTTSGVNITLQNPPEEGISEGNLNKYLWRFQPTDSKNDTKAPDAPIDLQARQRPGSIQLSWIAPTDTDPLTYIVLREENGEWNTIGRNVEGTTFMDNSVVSGVAYRYKVRAVDYAGNRSVDSEILAAQALQEKALLCQLQFDSTLVDNSSNALDASLYGKEAYNSPALSSYKKSGTSALNLSNGDAYLQLPYAISHNSSMTIATWVRCGSSSSNWQRIFDFGNGTDSYMFLTPSNGSEMRFVMKNGGDEEILSAPKLSTNKYYHIALTISYDNNGTTTAILYVDGEAVATKADFTINPSDIAPSLAYIGRSMYPADPLFKGYIDDFRVYNYALTAEEVAAIMEDTDEVSKDVIDIYEDILPTGINLPEVASDAEPAGLIYNVAGQPVQKDYRGIVIKGNTKTIQK